MTKLLTILALFALAGSAAFAAPPPGKGNPTRGSQGAQGTGAESSATSPGQQCRELRRALGASDFRAAYGGGPNAMGVCASRFGQASSDDADNAARRCRAERTQNPTAFRDKYGTNVNKANAFGKCVSALAGEAAEDRQEAVENAAMRCKAERALNPTAFRDKYGTNVNKANAFGKCVSRSVQASS